MRALQSLLFATTAFDAILGSTKTCDRTRDALLVDRLQFHRTTWRLS